MICNTFLLALLDDDLNQSSTLHEALQKSLAGHSTETQIEEILEELKARGAQNQLLMFLTGPAGAGKSTAVKTTRRFCFSFCRSAGIMWSDYNFLFTAYTGTAAMGVAGVDICKVAFLMIDRKLSEKDKSMWRDV